MNFCPRCGTALALRAEGGRPRPVCPAPGCGFTYYGDASIGTGAVVMRGDDVLLIERRTSGRTWWQIPGGFVEVDEAIHAAVEREVLEETGVVARTLDVVGFRHAAGVPERPVANIYVVFRLAAEGGEPRPDGEESFAAEFVPSTQVAARPGISAMSLWAIETALAAPRSGGLNLEPPREGLHRPGHTIFRAPVPARTP
ncbi:MAG: NUDIX domain-containing protein [Dehalococcoidia bacterium]